MTASDQCCCGAAIREVLLPPDIAEAAGTPRIWVHQMTGDTFCYEDSDDVWAEPAHSLHPRIGART